MMTEIPDYETLIAEAQARIKAQFSYYQDPLLGRLADAVEALRDALANEQALRAYEKAALVRINAERDALRTRLDSMTVEWGRALAPLTVDSFVVEMASESQAYAYAWATEVVVKRLVSPWVQVVPGSLEPAPADSSPLEGGGK